MAFRIDLHMHTRRHSVCSAIDPHRVIEKALEAGLDAIVITEHHYQWPQEELDELVEAAGTPELCVMAGFEYTSSKGDVLIYGLEPRHATLFRPGGPPEDAVARARDLGGACIAAHPTRAGMDFDERIYSMPFAGIEICSMNLKPHERELARQMAEHACVPPTASSDAHRIEDLGRFATLFDTPIGSTFELKDALNHGRFRVVDGQTPEE
jgi:predicted metal-dependent phosphoesterase TrpH